MNTDDVADCAVERPASPNAPRVLQDLAETIVPPELDDGELLFRASEIQQLELDRSGAEFVSFEQSTLTSCTVSDPAAMTLTDCLATQCGFATPVHFDKLVRVRFVDCKFSAADFSSAELIDVEFDRCVLAVPSFWRSSLRRVSIKESRFESADLTEARLSDVSFDQSFVVKPTLNRTTGERIDLSRCAELTVGRAADLKGWILATDQVVNMAVAMATEFGITVVDS